LSIGEAFVSRRYVVGLCLVGLALAAPLAAGAWALTKGSLVQVSIQVGPAQLYAEMRAGEAPRVQLKPLPGNWAIKPFTAAPRGGA
jgi:hypothetical protein